MASSSSSSSAGTSQWKYVVFLSFRGEDTRKTFTSHLYQGLKKRGIFTFQDDERLDYGDSIPEELMKGIKDSKAALVVFSKNYATSRWCLNELVKIMECKDKNGQTVIPIFYDVDPSHVRNQTESFAKAFAEHELKCMGDGDEGMQKVQGWRNALTAAANLKGFDIRGGIESDNIQQIVDRISKLCKSAYFLYSSKDVVGVDTHLEKVESLLKKEINDVRIVGIWGMGGIGKTTIATTIFHKYNLSGQFEAACILDDVKENAKKNGLCSLQNILLSELLGEKDNYVTSKQVGKCMIPSRLCSMKVLIVLDDIDHSDHLEYLAGDVSWFGNGSRVIVTTRNRDLIRINDDTIYEVKLLPDQEAMQLFNQHAFKKEVPDESFKRLSLEVVYHAQGLPLALKLWGSSLHKKDLNRWERTVDKIKKTSSLDIVEKLKISYDGLEPEEQEIFLDIACFFRRYEKKYVMEILESCDFKAEYGLDVLIDNSLVFLTEYDRIEMHDLIQDMGKYIVKMPKHPGERSRLWDVEDFKQVMADNTGTIAVEAIWFTYFEKLCFNKEAMKNMKMLRILYICDGQQHDRITSNCRDGSIEYLSNNLRWLVWHDYPWKLLPKNFHPRRLVHLDLRWSSLHHLWNETKVRRTDVLSAWSGIRPLAIDPQAKSTASISRDHVVTEDHPGLVTITGGKWTTYRSMAEDAVDAAIKSGKLNPVNKCLTYNLQLIGADGWDPASFTVLAQQYVRMKRSHAGKVVPGAMDTAAAKHLSHAYGVLAERVAAIAQNENLGKRLAHGYPFLEAEVAYCAREEYCESAVDFVARRCRLAFLDTDAAQRALPRIIEILAVEHKWDKSRQKQELQKGKEFLETFKSSKNAQFHDGKH